MKSKMIFRIHVLVMCFLASLALAQNTGFINGTVLDTQGAALPAANLILTNTATGQIRQGTSSSEGYFSFTDLPAGSYRLQVTASGFKEFTLDAMTLNVGQQLTVRPTLEIGSMSEKVEVTSTLAPVTTSTSSVAQVVDTQRIERLPLNGRNALQLVALVPGVVQLGSKQGQFGMTQLAFEVSGGRYTDMNFSLDGGFNMNTFYDIAMDYPNPDALQEFTVSTRTVSALFGRGTAAVSANTRSGTNEFHGAAFEFLRNTKLDARPFFAAAKPDFKRNQYGATLGGPIRKNKLFFFGSYQGTKERGSPGERRYRSLTPAERLGDFSAQPRAITDPDTGTPYPGSRIPPNLIRTYAKKFINDFLPPPNSGDFFSFANRSRLDQNQVIGKVDYSITDKDRLSSRYLFNNVPQRGVSNGPLDAGWVQDLPTRTQSWNVGYTHVFSSSWLTDARITHIRNAFGVRTTNSPKFSLSKIGVGVNDQSAVNAFGLSPDSQLSISNFFSAYTGVPTRDIIPTTHILETTSWVSGKHKLEFGVEIYKNRVNELQNFYTGGNMNFTGVFSGNAAADFLLGKFNDYRQISAITQRIRQTLPSLFVQEDLRVNRNLTLNLGVRWDPFRPWISEDNQFSAFRPGHQSKVYPNAPAGLLYPGDEDLPRSIVGSRWNNVAPRVGFAWDVFGNGKTSIRSGFGVYYVPITRGISFNRFTLILPFTLDLIVTGGDADNIFGRPPFNGVNPFPIPDRKDVRFTPTAGHTSFGLPFKTQTDRQWNFSIQQAIGGDSVLEVNYIGSSSSHLFTSDELNPGVFVPGVDASGRPLSSVGNIQARRIYPQFGQINDTKSALSSNYNGLQVSFNRRYSKGFSILNSYTWSKGLGVVGSYGEGSNGQRDPFHKRLDYGPLNNDIAHNFVTSFIWDLPLASKSAPMARRVLLGGWQLNGIHTLRTGFPFTIRSGRDNSLTGVGGDTADQVGDRSISGSRSRGDQILRWFNTDAFVQNAIGTVGSVGINSVRGPGLWNFDLGVSRNFRISESKRVEYRTSFFNMLNHPNLANPNGTQSSPTFGRITSMQNDGRVIELGLKFAF